MNENERNVQSMKRKTFRALLSLVGDRITRGNKVLDCGCATGFFLHEAEKLGLVGYGVDVNSTASEKATETIRDDRIWNDYFENVDFGDLKFDFIFMTDFLEHVRDPVRALKKSGELLNPDGLVVITTPNVRSMWRLLLNKFWLHYKPEHLHYYSARALQNLIRFHKLNMTSKHIKLCKKYLTFDYAGAIFGHHPNRILSGSVNFVSKIIPKGFRNYPLPVLTGDIVIVLEKTSV